MPTLLHLADVHLDGPTPARTASLRQRVHEAQRAAWTAAIDLAISEQVDAMLVAGDLFEGRWLSYDTERFLLGELRRLHEASIPCVYASGPADAERAQAIDWPEGVTAVMADEPQRVPVGDGALTVVACGYTEAPLDLAAWPGSEDGLTVGLLHTAVGTSGASGAEALRGTGYAYWALGHQHDRQAVTLDGRVQYPGTLQGRSYEEPGACGALLVRLPADGQAPDVTFRALAPLTWTEVTLDALDDVQTVAELGERLRDALAEEATSEAADVAVRVQLAGACPLAGALRHAERRSEVEAQLALELDVRELELRTVFVTAPVEAREGSLAALALEDLEALLHDEARLTELAPTPLAGAPGEEHRGAYLRRLLRGLDREALMRLHDHG